MYYIKTVETYCISCKKYTANEIHMLEKLNKTLMLLSNCIICGKKKLTFH